MKTVQALSLLEQHAFASLAFGVIGDAMGSPTEMLEPEEIERRFGWVDSFEGDGTDDVIMRDLLAAALLKTGGYAGPDDWAAEWKANHATIFGEKTDRFFPSILHIVEKLARGYAPSVLSLGTMPTTTSAMSITPVGLVNAGHPRAAAAQARHIASLVHVNENACCQDAAAAVAAAVAAALIPGASVSTVLDAAFAAVAGWGSEEMRVLMQDARSLAESSGDFGTFRAAYHRRFRRAVMCDSRETVPATFALIWLAGGDADKAVMLSANFGRDSDTIGCMAGGICGALQGPGGTAAARLAQLSPHVHDLQVGMAVSLSALARRKAATEQAAWGSHL